MDRLARLMPFRTFGRLRHLRGVIPCPPLETAAARAGRQASDAPRAETQPSALPAFARVSLNSALHAEPARRAPVRVYHGASRVILVGTIDAVCKMIDRCIDDERAGARSAQWR
jgi:hypothetical protein